MVNDVQAGEREAIKASEEVQRRNVISMMQFSNDTRKAVLDLAKIVDALQNKMMTFDKLFQEQRKQIAFLQQQLYQRGTVEISSENEGR